MTLAHGPWRVPKAPVHRHELRKFLAEVCHGNWPKSAWKLLRSFCLVKMLLLLWLSCCFFLANFGESISRVEKYLSGSGFELVDSAWAVLKDGPLSPKC